MSDILTYRNQRLEYTCNGALVAELKRPPDCNDDIGPDLAHRYNTFPALVEALVDVFNYIDPPRQSDVLRQGAWVQAQSALAAAKQGGG